MKMNYKSILSLALALVMVFLFAACSPAQETTEPAQSTAEEATSVAAEPAADAVTLRLGHTQSTEHLVNQSAEEFAAMVEEKTGGSVIIEIYPQETLGTNTELAEATSKGDVDLYISATGQYTSRYNPFTIVEAFYMFRDRDHLFAFYQSDEHQVLVEGLAEACDVHVLSDLYYGARQMTTSGTPLNTADDLNGLKMRAANEPMPIAAFTQLGAVPTPIAFNETYLALQQNTVDGQENPPASISSMKFYEVQDYMNMTYHQFQMLSIFLSDATMQSLSQEQIDALYESAAAVAETHNVAAVELEQTFVDEIGESCEIIEPDLESFRTKIAPMYAEFEDQWIEGMFDAIQGM